MWNRTIGSELWVGHVGALGGKRVSIGDGVNVSRCRLRPARSIGTSVHPTENGSSRPFE